MSACKHIWEVGVYHDGELPPEAARRLEAHLAQCALCARELRELRSLSRVLKGGPRAGVAAHPLPDAPAKVIERLHQKVAATGEAAVITLVERLTAAAAAILIALCAAWFWGVFGKSESSAAAAKSWEWAAVTLREEASGDTQQIAQWIVDNLSREKQHD